MQPRIVRIAEPRVVNCTGVQKIKEQLVVVTPQDGPVPPGGLTLHQEFDDATAIRTAIHVIPEKDDSRIAPTVVINAGKRLFQHGALAMDVGYRVNRIAHAAKEPGAVPNVHPENA